MWIWICFMPRIKACMDSSKFKNKKKRFEDGPTPNVISKPIFLSRLHSIKSKNFLQIIIAPFALWNNSSFFLTLSLLFLSFSIFQNFSFQPEALLNTNTSIWCMADRKKMVHETWKRKSKALNWGEKKTKCKTTADERNINTGYAAENVERRKKVDRMKWSSKIESHNVNWSVNITGVLWENFEYIRRLTHFPSS